MTEDRLALIEPVEKQADGDLVREMLAFAAERIMEAEVEARTGAAKGELLPENRTVTEAMIWRLPVSKTEEIRTCRNAGTMTRASRLAWRRKP